MGSWNFIKLYVEFNETDTTSLPGSMYGAGVGVLKVEDL